MLQFKKETVIAQYRLPTGEMVETPIDIRTHPITGRTSRIAFNRMKTRIISVSKPPHDALDTNRCPFCAENLCAKTPMALTSIVQSGRLVRGESVLFPNMFPYGAYSAVSLFDNRHFVQIGTASVESYANAFINSADYLERVRSADPAAVYMAITQNHLPSAGGSLLHPHLQVQADYIATNHQRFLKEKAISHFKQTRNLLLSDYLRHERQDGCRYIGETGHWHWLAAFSPEGFSEIWGILPDKTSLSEVTDLDWNALACGVLNTQRLYREFNRIGYNLGIIVIEEANSKLELRVVMVARANYAPWARNDHTGFEVMLGDMATFTAPEETAEVARQYWTQN